MNLKKLFFLRVSTAFVFAVFYSSLAIYISNLFSIKSHIINITTTFLAVYYILPVISGYVGSRWINFTVIFPIALIFEAIGCFLLALKSLSLVYLGLTVFLLGSCIISVSINIYIADQFAGDSLLKKKQYLINSIGMNLGILTGFLTSGLFDVRGYLSAIFVFAACLSIINGYIAYTLPRNKIIFTHNKLIKLVKTIVATFVGGVAIWLILSTNLVGKQLVFYALLATIIFLFLYTYTNEKQHRANYILYFSLLLLSIIFWSIYFLSPIILLPIIKSLLIQTQLSSFIAPQWIVAVDPLSVIVFTPLAIYLISKLSKNKSQINTSIVIFLIALILITLGLWLLMLGFHQSVGIRLYYFLGFIFIASIGELLIGPTGYSVAADLSQDKYRGILMGLWISSLGMSSIITSFLAKKLLTLSDNGSLIHMPTILTVITLFVAIVFFFSRKKLRQIKSY